MISVTCWCAQIRGLSAAENWIERSGNHRRAHGHQRVRTCTFFLMSQQVHRGLGDFSHSLSLSLPSSRTLSLSSSKNHRAAGLRALRNYSSRAEECRPPQAQHGPSASSQHCDSARLQLRIRTLNEAPTPGQSGSSERRRRRRGGELRRGRGF